jgi:alkanesulfonate monooxygenase
VTFRGAYYQIEAGRVGTPFYAGEPEVYLGGNSPQAADLAARHACRLFRFAEPPQALRPQLETVLARGGEVGLLVALVCRPTHAEAVASARSLVARLGETARAAHRDFERRSDSVAFTSTYALARGHPEGWLTDTLWAGAVPYLGAPAIALVGSPADVAGALLEYRDLGVSQFLFLGWPDLDEMTIFGREVLPLVRRAERTAAAPGG